MGARRRHQSLRDNKRQETKTPERQEKDTSQPIKWVKQQLGSRVPSVPSARLSASLEHSFMLCSKCTATIKSGQADLQAELQGYTGYT